MFGFWKIFFNTSLVKSWLVASWFLLLNLDSSWCLLMNLEINLDLELVDSILKLFFGLFVIIKTTWFILDSSSWSFLLHISHQCCNKETKECFMHKSDHICRNWRRWQYQWNITITNQLMEPTRRTWAQMDY